MKITSQVTINCPLETVWRFFDNPDNLNKWLTNLERYEHLSGEPGQVGAKSKQTFKENGRTAVLFEEITERIEQQNFSGIFTAPNMMHSIIEITFKNMGDESTEVTSCQDMRMEKIIFRLITPLMKGSIQKRQSGDLENLKKAVENNH